MVRATAACALAAACSGAPPTKPAVANAPAVHAPERWAAVATDEGGDLTLVKVVGDRVQVVAAHLPGGAFGWLDEHTLVVTSDSSVAGPRSVVRNEISARRYVDGQPVQPVTVADERWLDRPFVDSMITRGNELWISRLVEEGDDCKEQRAYRRVLPTPSDDQDHAPEGIDGGRVLDRNLPNPWPRPPTTTGPAGVTLTTGKVDVEVTDPYSAQHETRHDQVNGVICEAHGARVTYPRSEWDSMMGPDQSTRTVRWVSIDPAVFEIAEDYSNPAGCKFTVYTYVHACDPEYDGYAWLGDDRWASFALASHDPPNGFGPGEPPRLDGDWTFLAGDKVIGTIHGYDHLRANLIAP